MVGNNIIKEIRWFESMTSGKQKAFYRQMLDDARQVDVVPMSDVFTKDEIDLIKWVVKPQSKQCYRNAHLLTLMFPTRLKYVEGHMNVCNVLTTEHAFNKIGDKYIDITMELALGQDPSGIEYVALKSYDKDDIERIASETGMYGGMYEYEFRKKCMEEKELEEAHEVKDA